MSQETPTATRSQGKRRNRLTINWSFVDAESFFADRNRFDRESSLSRAPVAQERARVGWAAMTASYTRCAVDRRICDFRDYLHPDSHAT